MVQEEFEKIATDIRQRVIAVARGYRLDGIRLRTWRRTPCSSYGP